jgi:hypothetical protein
MVSACRWVSFVAIILCFPTERPVTKLNMNYASVITIGVVFLSLCVLLLPLTFSLIDYRAQLAPFLNE